MRTGTQLFCLCGLSLVLCLFGAIFAIEVLAFFAPMVLVLFALYVINIVREHSYVMREAKLQEFEVKNYWEVANKHPEVLSERVKRGMGFDN